METLSAYERQRVHNIAQNEQVLKNLGLRCQEVPESDATPVPAPAHQRTKHHRKTAQRPKNTQSVERRITRSSSDSLPPQKEAVSYAEEPATVGILTPMEEYFKDKSDNAIRSTGSYTGWVNGELMQKFGIECDAAAAWEANGGGKFTFKNMLGNMPTPLGPKPTGWSNVRHISSKLLKKNPNAYFYRHTAPGVKQNQGEWTEEEHQLFLQTARQFGCGDKWGLFSTYIPHRVGYQCSNYYRSVILTQGLVFDPNYAIDGQGNPVYIGPR